MDWAWRFGMIVVSMVPAIVGGGIAWALFESWTAVVVWEAVLVVVMGTLIVKFGSSKKAEAAVEHAGAH